MSPSVAGGRCVPFRTVFNDLGSATLAYRLKLLCKGVNYSVDITVNYSVGICCDKCANNDFRNMFISFLHILDTHGTGRQGLLFHLKVFRTQKCGYVCTVNLSHVVVKVGGTVVAVVQHCLLAGCGFDSNLGPFSVESVCSPWAYVGSFQLASPKKCMSGWLATRNCPVWIVVAAMATCPGWIPPSLCRAWAPRFDPDLCVASVSERARENTHRYTAACADEQCECVL